MKTARDAAWAPSLVFLIHAVASLGFRAYQRWPALDIPMHFLGGVVICYFYHRASINASALGLLGPFHPVTHAALVFALVGTTTVFWEFAEFITDRFFGTLAQVDLEDTLLDMLLGIIGGLVFLAAAAVCSKIAYAEADGCVPSPLVGEGGRRPDEGEPQVR